MTWCVFECACERVCSDSEAHGSNFTAKKRKMLWGHERAAAARPMASLSALGKQKVLVCSCLMLLHLYRFFWAACFKQGCLPVSGLLQTAVGTAAFGHPLACGSAKLVCWALLSKSFIKQSARCRLEWVWCCASRACAVRSCKLILPQIRMESKKEGLVPWWCASGEVCSCFFNPSLNCLPRASFWMSQLGFCKGKAGTARFRAASHSQDVPHGSGYCGGSWG